ncbi:hypothetical protein L3Q82_023647 [Scortum barcoo]|uniref:Uncharacterized protein n=1 Tax=Scortum barcoo TaxID=214431 RepID=A0ACB8WT23_9TELE|nr:hypothetical protein L3Q82_023647 [Scortum barcoo]
MLEETYITGQKFGSNFKLPRQKRRGRCSSKDGLAPSVSRPLSNWDVCGMNWFDQSGKHVPQISSLLLMNLRKPWKAIPGTYLKKLKKRMPHICHAMLLKPEEVTLKKAKSKQEKLKYLIIIVKMSSDKLLFM